MCKIEEALFNWSHMVNKLQAMRIGLALPLTGNYCTTMKFKKASHTQSKSSDVLIKMVFRCIA